MKKDRGIKGKYLVILVGLISTVLMLVVLLALDQAFPLSVSDRPVATVVIARDGTPLRAFADDSGVWRYPVSVNQVSPLYLQALIAYEDRWFFYHPGVNPFAMVRALFQNLVKGRVVSGGSTLTMQVARILSPNTRTIPGKIHQMLRAFQLEVHFTKAQILNLYLTHAPFGSNIEGVRTASHIWLGKDTLELTHAEAALLAVLPQAPSRYRPDRHPDRARIARDKVLDRLARFRVWPEKIIVAAKQEPVVAFRFHSPMAAPLASRRLRSESFGASLIPTFLDYDFQVHAADILGSYVTTLPEHQSGAVLVVNHRTLEVIAYVGSADFSSQRRKGHVDMVQALRSPGSALKPFLYGLAIDEGIIHSHSLVLDTPRFGKAYEPGNFSGGFAGPVSVTTALRNSLNIPAVQVLDAYGPQRFHDRLKHTGARLKFAGSPNLSMILGGMGMDLESLVTLYTALARDGQAGRPRLKPSDPVRERYLMSPGAAYITRQMLSRPLPGREGISRLSAGLPVAWKTGTSYGFRDAWALGIMGDFIVGVWVGRPDGSPSPGQYGAVTAVPLLEQVLESLPLAGNGSAGEGMPDTVKQQTICWPSGLAEDPQMPGACQVRHRAWILNHQIPPTENRSRGAASGESSYVPLVQTFWVDTDGNRAGPLCGGVKKISIALWPRSAEPWLPAKWRRNRLIPPVSDRCPDLAPLASRLRITSVFNDSLLTCPPGQKKPQIPLATLGGQGRLYWFLNGHPLNGNRDGKNHTHLKTMVLPAPGTYQLAVMDESGNGDMVTFKVLGSRAAYKTP